MGALTLSISNHTYPDQYEWNDRTIADGEFTPLWPPEYYRILSVYEGY